MNRRQRAHRAVEAAATASLPGTGSWVSWKSSKGEARGRVVSVHTGSKVPAVPMEVVGTKETPAARIQLYAPSKDGSGWEATSVYLAHSLSKLTVTSALPAPAATEAVAGSFDDVRALVCDAIEDRIEQLTGLSGSSDFYVYVADIGLGWVVYQVGDCDLQLVSWEIDAAGVVSIVGDPIEVFRQTMYVPMNDGDEGTGSTDTSSTPDPALPTDPADAPMMESQRDRIEGRLLGAKGTDQAGGRVFAVQIIAYGDSKNLRRYPEAVMRAGAAKYEGAKAYDHHRTDAELGTSTVSGIVGTYRNVRAGTTGIEADLHLLPSAHHTAELLDASLVNQASGLAPLVGISHDVMARYSPIVVDGRKFMEATAIVSVNSADVVAEPAAGGQALRMVAGGAADHITNQPSKGHTRMNLKQLLELLRTAESAKRAELLKEHAQMIESAGYTADEVVKMAEALPAPAGRSVEATTARSSIMTRQLVTTAVTAAGLDPRFVEQVLAELPEQVGESHIVSTIETVKRLAEGIEKSGLLPSVPAAQVSEDDHDKKVKALDAMFAGNYREGYTSLRQAWADITGYRGPAFLDTEKVNRQILRESIAPGAGADPYDSSMRLAESVASTTWSSILGDSITRRMVAEYDQPDLSTWRAVVSSMVPLQDFRTQRLERMGGYGTLPTVNQGAPYQPLTSPTNDTEVTYQLVKRGGTEDLTLETIANDDVGAIRRIPTKLGLAAAQTIFRFVWDFIITGGTTLIYDGVALFNAGHSNTTASVLSSTALETTRKNMRKQAAYGDAADILSLVPKFLLVPPDLEALAFELCTSAVAIPSGAPVGAASNTPNLHQGMTPIVVDYWSATSSTFWAVVADPSRCPTIELGFYGGQDQPSLFVQNDPTVGSMFNADKVTYKIRHIYSGAVVDFRGFSRGNS